MVTSGPEPLFFHYFKLLPRKLLGRLVPLDIIMKIESKKAYRQLVAWERGCLENDQMAINSGFPTVNCWK